MSSFRASSAFARPRRRTVSFCLSLLSLSALALNGCAAKRMKADFIGFEKAYAETSNREVLLNLARLQAHDTTYFFKLGQISSSYRMQASLTGAGNYVIQGTGVGGGNATGGGTPGLIFENDPSFTFIPVNDETSAQLLLKPIPAQTLYNLYLQGWRVDQLFRLMVDRIELSVPHPDKTCAISVIRNVPPPRPRGNEMPGSDLDYMADAASYATFLRVSALVYGLQRHGHLMLNGTSRFVPMDAGGGIPIDSFAATPPPPQSPPQPAQVGSRAAGTDRPDTSNAPKAADFASAAARNQSWHIIDTPNGKQWVLGQTVYGAEFSLSFAQPIPTDPQARDAFFAKALNELAQDDGLKGLEIGEGPKQVLAILNNKFSIEESPSGSSCTQPSAHLVMRSLIGVMAAAAQEEEAFDRLNLNSNTLPPDKQVTFTSAVPAIERQPALRLQWAAPFQPGPALAEVEYHGKYFKIADSAKAESNMDEPLANQYWNRDMFRLINQLTAQVTVDISKFPLPGILQVHQ